MSEPPRRRRSAPQRRDARPVSILPTIALGIGVVVAGLGIGAFLSALQRNTAHAPATAPTVGAMVITPVPQPSRDALAMETPVPHATSSPTPQASASASASAAATTAPTATAASTVTPAATPTVAPSPRRSASPRPIATATTRMSVVPAVAATPVARASSFVDVAESTVRRYIDAVITGNDASAYAAFGATPGDPNVRLTEAAFVDRSSHIIALRTTHTDATGSTIGVEVSSSHGSYYVTYHVSRAPGGAVIDGHDYIRE
jgi:cytoskeletal protein RodZ